MPLNVYLTWKTLNWAEGTLAAQIGTLTITYVTRKSVKGRIMAEQLADFPIDESQGPEPQFPDDGIFALEGENRWQLFFDGAANRRGNGIGILLVDPTDEHTPIVVKLNFEVTNNAAEYEACIAGLEANLERNIKELEQ